MAETFSTSQEINKSIKPIENYKKYIFFNNIKRSNNHFNNIKCRVLKEVFLYIIRK